MNDIDAETKAQSKPLPAAATAGWRAYARLLELKARDGVDGVGQENSTDYSRVLSMPAIRRVSMRPCRLERNPFRRRARKSGGCGKPADAAALPENAGWRRSARRRRWLLAALMLLQTSAATWSLAKIFPYPWMNGIEIAILAFFAILFSWISLGFWTAVAGFIVLWKGADRFSLDSSRAEKNAPLKSMTAVLMPICNEDIERAFAGLEAIYRSLAATGRLAHFDFFVLSDTGDPEAVVEEEVAWAKSCRALEGFGKVFYRHRKNNIKRKSGNIADFLRRWGANYDHMLVLDADSLMAGETLVALARLMETHPSAGIIQTIPATVNRESFFARTQQFANHAYGPMLAAGLHYWQLGESAYWGHNAILRIETFIKHCGLSRLGGRPPLGGEIMSHDFVEAALMGRAGAEVWLARDLGGSFEETPPTLIDGLKRDRRWCQGDMQHLRLLFADGFRAGHRALFFSGIMAYGSALLWAVFLALSTAHMALTAIYPPNYFPSGPSLFPLWPEWHPEWALALLSTTAAILFMPKVLSMLLITAEGQSRSFGGAMRLAFSMLLEILLSTLLAPIRMWFHAKFVLLTLLGQPIKWTPQPRSDTETDWTEAIQAHGASMIFAAFWMLGSFWMNPASSWWVLPVAVPLLLSAPLSVYTSRVNLGWALKKLGCFLIPEEIEPPEVVKRLHAALAERRADRRSGFVCAALDRAALAVHGGLLRGKTPKSLPALEYNRELRQKALSLGPKSLSASERARLLKDVESMAALHLELSERPEVALWVEAGHG